MTESAGKEGRGCGVPSEVVSSQSHKGKGGSLHSQPWYWPCTARCFNHCTEEAEHRMAGQPDGSFLIRDSSVPGDFTLIVRKDSCCKCVRIYRKEKGYSLFTATSDICFPTLPHLVEFYRHHSLASFNKRLDVCLRNPISKPATACNQYSVFKELYDLSQDRLSAETRLSVLQQQRTQLDKNVKILEMMMPALQVVKQMYFSSMSQQAEVGPMNTMKLVPDGSVIGQQQSGRQEGARDSGDKEVSDDEENQDEKSRNLSMILSQGEEKSLTVNTGLLLSRHSAVSSQLLRVRSHFDADSIKLRELEAELQRVEQLLLHMKRRHEELTRQMVELGCQEEYLQQVLEEQVGTREFDRSTWLVDCTRDEAVTRLKGLPHGAFLIRPKIQRRLPYVLSIVVSSDDHDSTTVEHCYIVNPRGRGFGFNAALAVFESIDQLVLRHRYVSLRHYIKALDVTLAFPVGCQELLRRSSDREDVTATDGVYANVAAIRATLDDDGYEPVEFPSRTLKSVAESASAKESVEDNPYEPVVFPGSD